MTSAHIPMCRMKMSDWIILMTAQVHSEGKMRKAPSNKVREAAVVPPLLIYSKSVHLPALKPDTVMIHPDPSSSPVWTGKK